VKIFMDTEFDQDSGPAINLISLGAIREDGVEFYQEADWTDTSALSPWLQENVVPHLDPSRRVSRSTMQQAFRNFAGPDPEWWGFCCAYDYLMICQLYGSFLDQPNGWPFYMNDLAQYSAHLGVARPQWPDQEEAEHNALADARWNAEVYAWLTTWDRDKAGGA